MRYFHVVFNIMTSSSLGTGTATFRCEGMFNRDNLIQRFCETSSAKAANVKFESTSIVNIIEMSEDDMNAFAPNCPFWGVV